jgi:hypothetical protein
MLFFPKEYLLVVDPEFSHEEQRSAEEILALCSVKKTTYTPH